MSHPSIFELRHFAVSGAIDEGHVRHVSHCETCAARLQRLATQALATRRMGGFGPLALATSVGQPSLFASMPAFLAVAATMLVLSVARPVMAHDFASSEASMVEPEGVHGVASAHFPERATAWSDGGSAPE